MAFSVLLLLKHPEAFPCSPLSFSRLFSSRWTEREAKTIPLQEQNTLSLQCQKGLCAVTCSLLLCPAQTRDEILLWNPFTARSVKLALVLVSAVA